MSGYQYPPPGEFQLPLIFACLFCATDPVQFHECSNLRLRRLSDVSQHVERCHLLQEVKLCTAQGAEAAIKKGNEKGTCTDPNHIRVYDPICRLEFRGPSAEADLERHLADNNCQPKTIEETGMLLPREFETLLSERDRATASPEAKWYAMWSVCFLHLTTTRFKNVPASPYVQTIVAREAGETRIRQALDDLPIPLELRKYTFDVIVNGLYPVQSGADAGIKEIVKSQQEKRTSALEALRKAEIAKLFRSAFDPSEVTSSEFPSAVPVHRQLQHQTLEQASNGMMGLSCLVPGEPHPSQWPYPTMHLDYPHPETEVPPEMSGPVYGQFMEFADYHPSNGYTGGFSDGY
ncbi:uncharacterized protein FSUBG_10665 [Fusarium subglutinans]|uniref:Uncharacterized protein n=1 Tax=Gibberella subglutinans TaxID=42677 RepID=A0A8H5LGI9_GIBSU|nr:uncharacterized protein FSUBG_10665 [Fusarium subglutinans]KAF5590936.1 hypothetical protein FSUBG_10665 [Fusarium subglutinans]